MKSLKKVTERQHFVTKGYLKGFTEADSDKFLWCYRKGYLLTPQKKSIRSIAWRPFYYEGAEVDNKMEKALGALESQVIPIIQGLESIPGKMINLSDEDKQNLALFIGFLFSRNPNFRDHAKEMRRRMVKVLTDDLVENDMKFKKILDENPDIKSRFEVGKVKIDITEWATLPEMVDVATRLMKSFLEKNWNFFVPSKDRYLITSDNPVYFDNAYAPNAGPAHPFSEVILHLRKDLALVLTPHSPDLMVHNMSNQEVNKFNKGVARAAREYVYSPVKEEALGRMIAKIKECSAEVLFF